MMAMMMMMVMLLVTGLDLSKVFRDESASI
jgi:hypothetical protein